MTELMLNSMGNLGMQACWAVENIQRSGWEKAETQGQPSSSTGKGGRCSEEERDCPEGQEENHETTTHSGIPRCSAILELGESS